MTRKRAIATAVVIERSRRAEPWTRRGLRSTSRWVDTWTHNDYTTSQALNEFDTGGTRFFVQREGNVFEVDLTDDDGGSGL